MENWTSLITGGGTTMASMIKAVQSGEIPDTEISCIIASTPEAGGIQKARDLNIPEEKIVVVDARDSFIPGTRKIDRDHYGERLMRVLLRHDTTVITQNGWLPRTPKLVTDTYRDHIFNQHPGPPEYFGGKGMKGKAVHAAVLEFQRLAGRVFDTSVVAHHVTDITDGGRVVKRRKIPVNKDDTVDTLQARALPEEHLSQIELLQDVVRGHVRALPPEVLIFPDEEAFLAEAMRIAIEKYPNG
jgi:phosphoribosylglycinamide formyltransferase 1